MILLCSTMVPLFISYPQPAYAVGTTYYVSPTGNDANDGLDPTNAHAWLTIHKAADTMVAGDTVEILTGHYDERVIPQNSGAAGNWITYTNYQNDVVEIDGGNTNSDMSIWVDYIQILDLHFVGTLAATGIQADGVSYLVIQDCYITASEKSGIEVGNSDNVIVDNCEVDATNTTPMNEGISFSTVDIFEIKNSTVHDLVAASRDGIDAKVGCSNGAIYNNEVYNNVYTGIYVDCAGSATSNISIYNNYVHDCDSEGISISDEAGVANLTNISIYNNILSGNHRGFALYQVGTETFDFTFINNTLYNNGGAGLTEVWLNTTHDHLINCAVRNNIIFSIVAGDYGIQYDDYAAGGCTIEYNLIYNSGGAWHAGNVLGTNYIESDPLLVSPTTDFSIPVSSPAKDTGTDTDAPATDYDGTARPFNLHYDIGAYEYSAVSTVTYAEFFGIIRAANNSTLVSNVASNITNISVTNLVNDGYITAATNSSLVMRTSAGSDIAFMPGYGTNTWMTWVSSLNTNGQTDYTLYTYPVSAGKVRYFPSNSGMTRDDVAGLELGGNFTITQAGYVNTSAGASKYLVYKQDAFNTYIASGNVTSGIPDIWITPTGNDASPDWTNPANAYDGNTGVVAHYDGGPTGGGAASWTSGNLTLTTPARISSSLRYYVSYTVTGTATVDAIDVNVYDGSWHDVYDGSITQNVWVTKDYPAVYTITKVNVHFDWSSSNPGDAVLINVHEMNTQQDAIEVTDVVSTGEHIVKTSADGTDLKLYIDNVEVDSVALGGVTVPNNANNWSFLLNGAMPYMEYHRITVGGNLKQYVYWEYASTFTDHSGSGIDMTTTNFAVDSSDPDVTAWLVSFGPIEEARAPAYSISAAPDFITTAPNLTSDFSSTSVTPTVPGGDVITAIATSGSTPAAVVWTFVVGFIIIVCSILATYVMRKFGSANSIFVKMFIIVAIMGVSVAVKVFDFWMILLYLIPAIAVAWASRSQGQGTVMQ